MNDIIHNGQQFSVRPLRPNPYHPNLSPDTAIICTGCGLLMPIPSDPLATRTNICYRCFVRPTTIPRG